MSLTPYSGVIANSHDGSHDGQGEPTARSGLIEHVTPKFASAVAQLIDSGASYFFQIRSVGGAVQDVDPEATAYAGRSANFSVVAFGANRTRLSAERDKLYDHFNGLYLSFETDLDPERIDDAFPPATLARLRQLKLRYDSENVFRDNFTITRPGIRS